MKYPGRVIKEGESDKTIVSILQAELEARGCGPVDKTRRFRPEDEGFSQTIPGAECRLRWQPAEDAGKESGQATLMAKEKKNPDLNSYSGGTSHL